MFNYVQVLFFILVVVAITNMGTARSVIITTNGCYEINSKSTCPPEIINYVPAGPDDVFFIDPLGNITGQSHHQIQQQETIQQQVVDPGKGVEVPIHQQGDPTQTTGGGGALRYRPR